MPVLTNPRHEAFALAIVESITKGKYKTQAEAYRAAGYKPTSEASAKACASRLLTIANRVGDRVRELQEQVARRKRVTVESIVDELEEARALAKDKEHTNTMVAATSAKAKILGLSVDRVEQGKPGDFANADNAQATARMLLRSAGMDESEISDVCVSEAITALEHFNGRVAAIVAGTTSPPGQAS
jgi:phage terminase small subunit